MWRRGRDVEQSRWILCCVLDSMHTAIARSPSGTCGVLIAMDKGLTINLWSSWLHTEEIGSPVSRIVHLSLPGQI